MKILFISNYYPPYYFGGYELKCQQIATRLEQKGHDISILTGDYRGQETGETQDPENIRRTLRYDTPETGAWARLKIEKSNHAETLETIRQIVPDVIYLWNQRGITLGPSMAVCNSGKPKIYQIGDFWPNTYIRPGRKAGIIRKLRTCLPFGINGIPELSPAIVVGAWMADEFRKKFGSRTVHHVPHGVDLPPPPDLERHLGMPRFLYAGRIDREKGLDIAIGAFALLKQQGETANFEFNILGGGDESYIEECRKQIHENGLEQQIHFLGKTREIDLHYASHGVLIMPTLMREPFGLVIIEAMSHGMIPVVSDNYGPREIVHHQEDGLRFQTADIAGLAEIIRRLIHDPRERQRLAGNARRTVETRFPIDREVSKLESLLLKLIPESQPPAK